MCSSFSQSHVTYVYNHVTSYCATMASGEGGLRYKDKVTIVTGGSKGIGEGCVRVFGK